MCQVRGLVVFVVGGRSSPPGPGSVIYDKTAKGDDEEYKEQHCNDNSPPRRELHRTVAGWTCGRWRCGSGCQHCVGMWGLGCVAEREEGTTIRTGSLCNG